MNTSGSQAARSLSPWLLLCFAPLWDGLWAGQVNPFVLLCLAMTWLEERRARERSAGLWLSVAIVLKASPALLLAWLAIARRWRAIGWTLLGVALWSALAAAVWGVELLAWYRDAVVATIGVDYAFSNLGVRAFTNRVLGDAWGGPIAIVLLVLAVAASLRRGDRFSRLVIVMTMFSPLVWYHHLVYFVVPIVLHMKDRPLLVWTAVACVQLERPLCNRYAMSTAVPVLIAAALLFVAAGRTARERVDAACSPAAFG